MKNKIIPLTAFFVVAAVASGCAPQPTVHGDTVRTVMQYQIHNYETALHPEPNAVEGSDPDRLNSVLEAYRQDVSAPQEVQQPISISIGQ